MLASVFELIGIPRGRYLDLGAHDPLKLSNTHLLYEMGWSGVNVEANPKLIPAFLRDRPRDTTLNLGVGVERGTFPFFMLDPTSGLNSFCEQELKDIGAMPQANMGIEVVTIDDIVKKHFAGRYPELLSVDIEGWDHEVLASAQFGQSRPQVICAEIRPWKSQRTVDLLANWQYFPLIRQSANLIFVQERYREKLTT